MANNSLSVFKTVEGIELVIREDGECFYPGYRALARVTSIGLEKPIFDTQVKRTVESALEGATDLQLFEAEIQTQGGLQGATLIHRKLGTKAIRKYNPNLYEAMAEAGHLLFLHQLVGYKPEVKQEIPKPVYLPVVEQMEKLIDISERYKKLFGTINPQVEAALKDLIHNTLLDQKQLQGSSEIWMGVVNFCEKEFGFVCPKKGEFRDSALGTWVKFYYPHLAQKQESRYCNETNRDIWVYPIHECKQELTEAVKAFIDCPAPGSKLKGDGAFKRVKH